MNYITWRWFLIVLTRLISLFISSLIHELNEVQPPDFLIFSAIWSLIAKFKLLFASKDLK
jgi:hypothetical protein